MPRFRFSAARVELLFALSACTPRPAATPEPLVPETVSILGDAAAVAEIDDTADAFPEPAAAPPVVTLGDPWFVTDASETAFTTSIFFARRSSGDAERWLDGADAGAGITPEWFAGVERSAESASRFFANAYHARDASEAEKIAAVLAGAESALRIARRLDDLGLAVLPARWRTHAGLALTFEDVASGPVQRWRDEGHALVQLCIEAATDLHVEDANVAKCKALRKLGGRVAIRRAFARDAGARGCRCQPGDPLCSENASWCLHP